VPIETYSSAVFFLFKLGFPFTFSL
jgi:hypothetical protein